MSEKHLIPLAFLAPGESAILREIRGIRHHPLGEAQACAKRPMRLRGRRHLLTADKGHRMEHRLKSMGFFPGTRIEMIRNDPAKPLVIGIRDCRLCIGRGIAMRLMVERE